jgi:hypothetical protein
LQDGRRVIVCVDDPEATAAVLMRGRGVSPLTRRTASPANAYVGVRIRGIVRNRPFRWHSRSAGHEWVKLFDNAQIVQVTGGRCLINLPR